MPDSRYQWSTSDSNIAVVTKSGLLTGLNFGMTFVSVASVSMECKTTGMVHVVPPSFIVLKLTHESEHGGKEVFRSPLPLWYLVVGRNYTLEIELYDAEQNRIEDSKVISLFYFFFHHHYHFY
jgi:hypothetical protein